MDIRESNQRTFIFGTLVIIHLIQSQPIPSESQCSERVWHGVIVCTRVVGYPGLAHLILCPMPSSLLPPVSLPPLPNTRVDISISTNAKIQCSVSLDRTEACYYIPTTGTRWQVRPFSLLLRSATCTDIFFIMSDTFSGPGEIAIFFLRCCRGGRTLACLGPRSSHCNVVSSLAFKP